MIAWSLLPGVAAASVDPADALHAYARARLADSDGALALAASSYRTALGGAPDNVAIARRSYVQALESGDQTLALQAAAILDQDGLLPRDGTLLEIADALARKDWADARSLTDRMAGEGNFAFLTPIVTSWIALGEGKDEPPVIDAKSRFGMLARRYLDEHLAFLAAARRDRTASHDAMLQALSIRTEDLATLRLAFAAQLVGLGEREKALALLPADIALFEPARRDIAKGKARDDAARLTPRQGFARLITRLAADVASDGDSVTLAVRLARIATFADPANLSARLLCARLLLRSGAATEAVAELDTISAASWYHPLARTLRVEALADAGREAEALTLARSLASAPGAASGDQVRLGRLLADSRDFAGAAAAFRAAQAQMPADAVPWTLLLLEGSALEQGGKWEEARAVLERAAKLAPDEPVILNYLGYAQVERRQNVGNALTLIRKAKQLKPDDASITDSLGWAQFLTGDVDAAIPVLEQAAAGAPHDVTINEHLGDALWAAGRRYEARYAWQAAAIFAEGIAATRIAAKSRDGMKPEYAAP